MSHFVTTSGLVQAKPGTTGSLQSRGDGECRKILIIGPTDINEGWRASGL